MKLKENKYLPETCVIPEWLTKKQIKSFNYKLCQVLVNI